MLFGKSDSLGRRQKKEKITCCRSSDLKWKNIWIHVGLNNRELESNYWAILKTKP